MLTALFRCSFSCALFLFCRAFRHVLTSQNYGLWRWRNRLEPLFVEQKKTTHTNTQFHGRFLCRCGTFQCSEPKSVFAPAGRLNQHWNHCKWRSFLLVEFFFHHLFLSFMFADAKIFSHFAVFLYRFLPLFFPHLLWLCIQWLHN